jgi:hypothetical protein
MSTDPLLMNAFNNINLAAAVIVTSTEVARRLGIAESKWIYPLGGAGTQDASYCKFQPVVANKTDILSLGASQFLFKSIDIQVFRRGACGFTSLERSNRPLRFLLVSRQ